MTKRQRGLVLRHPGWSVIAAALGSGAGAIAAVYCGPQGTMTGALVGFLIGGIAGAVCAQTMEDHDIHDRLIDEWANVPAETPFTPPEAFAPRHDRPLSVASVPEPTAAETATPAMTDEAAWELRVPARRPSK